MPSRSPADVVRSVPTLPIPVKPDADRADTHRLPLPDAVEPGSIYWLYTAPIVGIHFLALSAVWPWLFSWTGLIVAVLGVHVFGQGITIGYHRLLTHRSFRTPKWVEHGLVYLALFGMQDTPGRWVATHRYHHLESDHQPDPHSPLVGFLWAHVGWLLVRNRHSENMATYQRYARDVLADPWYMRLEKDVWRLPAAYALHAAAFFAVGFGVGWATGGSAMAGLRFGLSLLVWGVFVRTVAVWHITWSVNSLTHLFGYRNHATGDHSTNNWFVALLTVGEGWHNNHHHDQGSASNQHRWWELDLSYYEIKTLERLGLASHVRSPRPARVTAGTEAGGPELQSRPGSGERSG
ncbi:MAG: fatty acid desaturase [Planctomycetota bacterium]